ncbi:hypothetical protein [Protaetiibacter intestinalis]|uniref:DUF2029 domain-containing protein n=1 Tax=Protaetiibacter intestinalis TaxID=2419774 RepID=A0A387B830_9MICO|nr:hypothetical protein [Protaetiibacter intestinalis]AYF98503.1 hypothetical protein D7I47_09695 [Protaetiibacter intestinalis]
MAGLGRLSLAARVRWRLTPWWGRVLLVFAASRAVTGVAMLCFAVVEAQLNQTVVPDPLTFANNWDGKWYAWIASFGYPTELPVGHDGVVQQNAWAFLPVYPFLLAPFVRAGIPFALAGVVLTLAAGAAASLLFFVLLRENGFAPGSALFAVVLLCTAPVSPIFQVTYADALGLALLFLALLLVVRRRFVVLLPVLVVMALTRPSGLAFALFLLLYFVTRVVRAIRTPASHPLPPREAAALIVAGLTSAAAGLAWPAIAWAVTGSPTAYTDTELAWRSGYVGTGGFEPFVDWFHGIAFWLGFYGAQPADAMLPAAVVLTLLAVALFGVFLVTPWARRLGMELRWWLVGYLVYLLAVFFPQSSTWRLLLPLSPALGAFAVPRSRVFRTALVVLGIAGQLLWIHWYWLRMPGDWSPP